MPEILTTLIALFALRTSFGSLAMFAAIRRASSRVTSLAARRRPRLILEVDVGELLTIAVAQDEAGVLLLDDHGGGKRRGSTTPPNWISPVNVPRTALRYFQSRYPAL
jgi:hypothetical protein